MNLKRKSLWLLAVLFAGALVTASCSDDNADADGVEVPQFSGVTDVNLSNVEAVDSGFITWHDYYSKGIKLLEESNDEGNAQLLKYFRENLHKADSIDAALAAQYGANTGEDGGSGMSNDGGIKFTTLRYESVDENNQKITLSELVAWPRYSLLPNPNPNNLVIGCHCTITSNNERPTNYKTILGPKADFVLTDVGLLTTHASGSWVGAIVQKVENLVVIPDYEGYGVSSNRSHPYLYQELTARQVVDGARAAVKWYEQNEKAMESDWKSVAVGYSQGGATAMAVHRYIEQNDLADEMRFAGSVCGDGPYSPEATVKAYIRDKKVYMPVAVALIFKGLMDTNPYMSGHQPGEYFNSGFAESGIMDWVASKQYTTDQIQQKLADYAYNTNNITAMRKSESGNYWEYVKDNSSLEWEDVTDPEAVYYDISQIFKPEVIDYFNGQEVSSTNQKKMDDLMKALRMNNLTSLDKWTMEHPMIVFHSMRDEVVPFDNYQWALAAFNNEYFKGIRYDTNTYTHVSTGSAFYAGGYEKKYVTAILEDETGDYKHNDLISNDDWY